MGEWIATLALVSISFTLASNFLHTVKSYMDLRLYCPSEGRCAADFHGP